MPDAGDVHSIATAATKGIPSDQLISWAMLGLIAVIAIIALVLWITRVTFIPQVKSIDGKVDALITAFETFKTETKESLKNIKSEKEVDQQQKLAIAEHVLHCENRGELIQMSRTLADVVRENTGMIKEFTGLMRDIRADRQKENSSH